MSGLVLISHSDGSPVGREVVERMMAALSHRGPDGAELVVRGTVGLGCQHFWTTAEEIGCRQPVERAGGALSVLFDGRIDNRRELLQKLGLPGRTTDAEVVLNGYVLWGEGLFERLLGPFAIAVHERFGSRTVCARDAMGERSLFYSRTPRVLVIASEETALLSHPEVSSDPDEESVARHFALAAPRGGSTFYAAVRELKPGVVLRFDAQGESERRFWTPPEAPLRYRRVEEYAEHFGELLESSVACRMRSAAPAAVLMSGGLDSSSLAAVAARGLAKAEPPARLPVISWIFDELESCDERPYMDAMVRAHDLRPVRILCDDAWPLRFGAASWPRDPNTPLNNPYRLLLDRAYRATGEQGGRVLLTGWFGDLLYGGIGEWWADLVRDGRLGEACVELIRSWRGGDSRNRSLRPLRSALAAWTRRWRPLRRPGLDRHPWLTTAARQRLNGRREAPDRAGRLLTGSHQWYAKAEARAAAQFQVDVRHPFWDRRLVEFALAVPRFVLFRPGREKHVLREALADDLPLLVRDRRAQSSLAELFRRGIMEREVGEMEAVLENRAASWRRYVSPDWLWALLHDRTRSDLDGPESVIAWTCLSWELWRTTSGKMREPMEVAR